MRHVSNALRGWQPVVSGRYSRGALPGRRPLDPAWPGGALHRLARQPREAHPAVVDDVDVPAGAGELPAVAERNLEAAVIAETQRVGGGGAGPGHVAGADLPLAGVRAREDA